MTEIKRISFTQAQADIIRLSFQRVCKETSEADWRTEGTRWAVLNEACKQLPWLKKQLKPGHPLSILRRYGLVWTYQDTAINLITEWRDAGYDGRVWHTMLKYWIGSVRVVDDRPVPCDGVDLDRGMSLTVEQTGHQMSSAHARYFRCMFGWGMCREIEAEGFDPLVRDGVVMRRSEKPVPRDLQIEKVRAELLDRIERLESVVYADANDAKQSA